VKAREIKRELVYKHKNYTENYVSTQIENSRKLNIMRAQIEELEGILNKYFGVTKSFFTETTRIDEDVPF